MLCSRTVIPRPLPPSSGPAPPTQRVPHIVLQTPLPLANVPAVAEPPPVRHLVCGDPARVLSGISLCRHRCARSARLQPQPSPPTTCPPGRPRSSPRCPSSAPCCRSCPRSSPGTLPPAQRPYRQYRQYKRAAAGNGVEGRGDGRAAGGGGGWGQAGGEGARGPLTLGSREGGPQGMPRIHGARCTHTAATGGAGIHKSRPALARSTTGTSLERRTGLAVAAPCRWRWPAIEW